MEYTKDNIVTVAVKQNRPELIYEHPYIDINKLREIIADYPDFKEGCIKTDLYKDEMNDTYLGCDDLSCSQCTFDCDGFSDNTPATILEWLESTQPKQLNELPIEYCF